MLTLLSERPPEIQRFRAKPWPFQQTFKTPLKNLNRFVSTFLAPFSLERGALSTDEVVFEPKELLRLLYYCFDFERSLAFCDSESCVFPYP